MRQVGMLGPRITVQGLTRNGEEIVDAINAIATLARLTAVVRAQLSCRDSRPFLRGGGSHFAGRVPSLLLRGN